MSGRERDKKALGAALDEGPWATLLALADWHDEGGEADAAAGYRWLAAWKREPMPCKAGRWLWYPGAAWMKRTTLPTRRTLRLVGNDPEDLPRVSWRGIVRLTRNGGTNPNFATRRAAYHAAAVAVGRWLKEES